LDSEFDKKYPDMELQAAYGMRNSLSHGYFLVDPVLVWGTIQTDIPPIKETGCRRAEGLCPTAEQWPQTKSVTLRRTWPVTGSANPAI
jgi:hypothetical protein